MEGVYWGWREFTRSLLGLGEFTGGLGSLRGSLLGVGGVYWGFTGWEGQRHFLSLPGQHGHMCLGTGREHCKLWGMLGPLVLHPTPQKPFDIDQIINR